MQGSSASRAAGAPAGRPTTAESYSSRTASTAVMARRAEPADSLDYFPTPPWGTRAFCEHLLPRFERRDAATGVYGLDALDPCCGEGHMALALREYFPIVTASDLFGYGFGDRGDFMHPDEIYAPRDWVVMNPPFNLGVEFILRALKVARRGVAALVRTGFLEGEERQDRLFAPTPPALVAQFVERLPMHRGRWVVNGKSATAYSWLVWHTHQPRGEPRFCWLPKSRRQLTRHDDWLRFSGCQDLPPTHPAMAVRRDWMPTDPLLRPDRAARPRQETGALL
jgi:hypothetical protein